MPSASEQASVEDIVHAWVCVCVFVCVVFALAMRLATAFKLNRPYFCVGMMIMLMIRHKYTYIRAVHTDSCSCDFELSLHVAARSSKDGASSMPQSKHLQYVIIMYIIDSWRIRPGPAAVKSLGHREVRVRRPEQCKFYIILYARCMSDESIMYTHSYTATDMQTHHAYCI